MDRLVRQIQELRQHVDHVIVSLHWGEERFLIPSPVQVEQAHALADAGASMVLGHHPHVLQGLEVYRGVPIIYSLGNFVADEVHFTNGDAVRWDRVGQTGCILRADFTKIVSRTSTRCQPTIRDIWLTSTTLRSGNNVSKPRIMRLREASRPRVTAAKLPGQNRQACHELPALATDQGPAAQAFVEGFSPGAARPGGGVSGCQSLSSCIAGQTLSGNPSSQSLADMNGENLTDQIIRLEHCRHFAIGIISSVDA